MRRITDINNTESLIPFKLFFPFTTNRSKQKYLDHFLHLLLFNYFIELKKKLVVPYYTLFKPFLQFIMINRWIENDQSINRYDIPGGGNRWKLEQGVSRESGSVKSNCLPDRSASGGTPWWFFWAQPRTPIKSKSPTGHCGRYSEQLPLRPTTSAWRMSCGSSSCRELVGLKTTTPTIRTYHLDDNKELFLSLSLPLPLLPLFPPPPLPSLEHRDTAR